MSVSPLLGCLLVLLTPTLLPLTAHAGDELPRVSVVVGELLKKEGGSGDGKPGALDWPFGIDFDSGGHMIIVELTGGRVHRLDTEGKLTQIAGDGSKSYRGDGGPAHKATFNGMHNVAVAPNDDIYIADSWNHCIRRIDAKPGLVSTVAGTGEAGFSGDGGPAQKASFNYVMCVTLGPENKKIYVADLKNRRVRVIDLESGIVETVAGNGNEGVPNDKARATESPLVDPRAVAVDSRHRVYILERSGHALRRVNADGTIETVAGTGKRGFKDGPALQALLAAPKHICVDDRDRVIIADDANAAIRRYDPETQTVTTLLGHGKSEPPIHLSRPHGVCFEKGRLYVVDTGHHRILRIDSRLPWRKRQEPASPAATRRRRTRGKQRHVRRGFCGRSRTASRFPPGSAGG